MDADLKQYLEGMETQLTERVDAADTQIAERQSKHSLETPIIAEFWN